VASAFSHVIAALGIGACFYRPEIPRRVWVLGGIFAAAPDLDVLAFRLGIPYEHLLGHRGLTHSLFFAAIAAWGTVAVGFRRGVPGLSARALTFYLFLATASHGMLDALTNGGLGVAFFAPIENSRYFFPVQPIEVSPIGVRRFFTERGWAVIRSELLWVWGPSALVAGAALLVRQGGRRRPAAV
jgi:inner membrane protein